MNKRARLIAFYLPQFHPIPENDRWWGNGFTEWTNVKKAKPLFSDHYQPRIPTEIGYYDLRNSEIRQVQADLAKQYGIEGFCYWHYWFAGKRLLEQPFNEVLKSGKPDLPFCLAWANESWTGVWLGCPRKTLIAQTYPGREDNKRHFYTLLSAFHDTRYITIEGKPVFLIYRPHLLNESKKFIELWNELAIKNGLKGIYFIANMAKINWPYQKHGFDGMIYHLPALVLFDNIKLFKSPKPFIDRTFLKLFGKSIKQLNPLKSSPYIVEYNEYIQYSSLPLRKYLDEYPCVVSNWDNTPRCGINGVVLHNSTPELFRVHLRESISKIKDKEQDKRIVFVRSWNEWGEGNYLEPDERFGFNFLKVCDEESFLPS